MGVLLASSEENPKMLINTHNAQDIPQQQGIIWPKYNNAEVEKFCWLRDKYLGTWPYGIYSIAGEIDR